MRPANKALLVALATWIALASTSQQRAHAYTTIFGFGYDEEGDVLGGEAGIFRTWESPYNFWYEGACECYIYYHSCPN